MKKVIKLVGEVSTYDISAEYIEGELNGLTEEDTVEFVIHSGGGSVFEGMYIYNLLLACKAKKVGYIYGISASMMTVLGVAMDELYMSPLSMYMTHNVSSLALGNASEMEQSIELVKKLDSILLDAYKKKTKMSEDEIVSTLMNSKDNWFTPTEALNLGLIDGIEEPNTEIVEKDSDLSEYNYNSLMDVAAANVESRSKALNKLVTLNFSQMENTELKEKETLTNISATSETTDMIAALNLELDNHKKIIGTKDAEIANLSTKVTELEKEKDSVVLEAQNEVRKAKESLDAVSNSIAEKDKQLYAQEVVNRVNLAVAKISVNGKSLSNDKQKELSNAFRNRRSCVIDGEKESVVDRYSNEVVSDNIESALRHYAKEGGYVPTQSQGINASANVASNDFSFSNAQNAVNEDKAILKRQKELNKQGFGDYSKGYVASMLSEFGNSENVHIQALKKMKF